MKGWAASLVILTALLVAAPEAGAEEIQTVDTISVVGIGRVPIAPMANAAEADAVYHQALVQAAADGLLKARLLAEASGAKVGPIEAISERGDKEIECKGATGESATYRGARPDSGAAEAPTLAVKPAVPPQPAKPAAARKRKRKVAGRKGHRFIARVAENTATSCELTTGVSLIYDLEAP
jgi:uncharacterized protein YggE